MRKWAIVRPYRLLTIACSSAVAPALHSPLIQSAEGKLKSPMSRISGVGEGRDSRNSFSLFENFLNFVIVDLCSGFVGLSTVPGLSGGL